MRPIDLTMKISETTPVFPGSPGPQFIEWSDIKNDGYNLELLFFSSHTGTHMDAPYHFENKGIKVDEIPMSRLVTSAIMIKLSKDANRLITKADITSFERNNAVIPDGSSVIFHTGWQRNLGRPNFFAQNPGLGESAAQYLASKEVNMVGIDAPSIDVGKSRSFAVHHVLLGNNILVVENLTNLHRVPEGRLFDFIVLPLKLKGATGSPVRAVALL